MRIRTKIALISMLGFLAFSQTGCGGKRTVYLETSARTEEAVQEKDAVQTEDRAQEEHSAQEEYSAQGEAGVFAEETEDVVQTEETLQKERVCYVYVCGAVAEPGVYVLPENSRIYEAVALAGGLLETAGADAFNQAELVTDGQMLRVPTQEEVLAGQMAETADVLPEETKEQQSPDGRVNLNTASSAELMTLPGIGQSKADAIVNYRTKNGQFSTTEEIMKVEGIKEGVYNRVKDSIKVK